MKEVIKVRALALDGRRKIEMMWGENASTVKIAAELGISQCTVYTELKRGRYVRAGVDVELDKYVLNQHILPYIGGCRLRDITPMQIQSIMAVLSDKSNSLQPKVLVNLRSISNEAHILRHTYITRLFEAGLAVKEIQYLTGHSTMDMTLKVYTHYDRRSREAKTAEKVRNAFRASI